MIDSLKLKFGRSPEATAETILTTPLTVFIGPNNSGKSKLLSEIWGRCTAGSQFNEVVLEELPFNSLREQEANFAIDQITIPFQPNETQPGPDFVKVGDRGATMQVNRRELLSYVLSPASHPIPFSSLFMRFYTLMLDGGNRLNIINSQNSGDFTARPENLLQVLARDEFKRNELRRISKEAFQNYFVLDMTGGGMLRARLSRIAPRGELDELSVTPSAIEFQSQAVLAENSSDGVRAYLGILAETMAGFHKVLLVDEPEAFLHPSLATSLGAELARAARSYGKKIFASTHSAAFLMGCIQSGVPINIVRLTHQDGVSTARTMSAPDLAAAMRDPLLRSAGVLNGLFYSAVIVTESDTDRAFYQEINERLLRYKPEWGISNCLFLNAQNKQTIRRIVSLLRRLGIAAAGIVDIDIVKEGGAVWTSQLADFGISPLAHESFAVLRSSVYKAMQASGKDMKKDGGVKVLSKSDQRAALYLVEQLDQYGLFLVPGGELESWLKELDLEAWRHGPDWLLPVFEKLGDDPEDPDYVKPGEDDVWAFLGKVKGWLTNPSREGLPD